MSRPTYNPITDATLAIDEFGRATDVYQYLRDNIAAARVQLIAMDIAEATGTSTSYATLFSFPVTVPSAAAETQNTAEMTIWLEAKVTANSADYRLQDQSDATTGSSTNVTGTTYAAIELTLPISDSWRGTTRTILVEAKQNTSGTHYGRAEDSNASWLDY